MSHPSQLVGSIWDFAIVIGSGWKELMKAAWYESQGAARDVLVIGHLDEPLPQAGEVWRR